MLECFPLSSSNFLIQTNVNFYYIDIYTSYSVIFTFSEPIKQIFSSNAPMQVLLQFANGDLAYYNVYTNIITNR